MMPRIATALMLLPLLGLPVSAAQTLPTQAAAARSGLTPQPAPQAPPTIRLAAPMPLTLQVGTGRLITLPAPVVTVLAADPRIARIQPASPTSLFVMAVAPGSTTVIAAAEDGTLVAQYDVTVLAGGLARAEPIVGAGAPPVPPAATMREVEMLVRRMIHGDVHVTAAGRTGLVLTGNVATAADAQRAEAVAQAAAGGGREVINNLTLLSSIQVNLRVRVAEISRQVQRELGFNWQALANTGSNFMIGLRTGGGGRLPAALLSAITPGSTAPFGGAYGMSYRSSRFDINAVVDALAADQLITILAEPNLTAQSGEVASFLAGGEFPVPVAASGVTNSITIEFKQFGVSLAFIPTVLGPERLNLRVRPEVSELSDNGAISVPLATGVVKIPALTVRRAETTIELGSGQSFAIAGLLQRNSTLVNSGPAGAADIPVLGALFRSDRFKRDESELVIIITPYLVRPVSGPNDLAAPTDGFRSATDLERIIERRQLARGSRPGPVRGRLDAGFILE